MKIVKLDILEDAILQGVDQIAFVESPAIEEDYYAFKKQTFATYTDYPKQLLTMRLEPLSMLQRMDGVVVVLL